MPRAVEQMNLWRGHGLLLAAHVAKYVLVHLPILAPTVHVDNSNGHLEDGADGDEVSIITLLSHRLNLVLAIGGHIRVVDNKVGEESRLLLQIIGTEDSQIYHNRIEILLQSLA